MDAPIPLLTPEPPVPPASSGATLVLDILDRVVHASKSEWLFLRELRVGTGFRNSASQRLDAFALNCLPHTGMKRICYEVKTSRADFLGELRQPLKRRIGMRYSNEFYFATPAGLLKPAEVPVECGLIEAGIATPDEWKQIFKRQAGFFAYDPDTGAYCLIVVPAPWRDTPGPTWQFVAAMMRNQRKCFEEKPPPPPTQQKMLFT